MMQQGMNTLEIDRMAPQAQGIEALGSMEEVPMVPEGGIQAAVPDATRMLAAAGREGDIYIVHASEGDTVIPEEVLAGEGGAQIRESLFRQMEQMGVDPGRYVVGNKLNSINPETGLPEFFFKKIFKSVKKFFKKAAPIILPIALSLIPGLQPLGAVALGALGSGAGTLIAGGSAKDALKAAAFGGITAGITSGLAGGIAASKAGGDFFSGFGTGLQASVPALGGIPAKSVPNIFQAVTGEAGTFAPSGAFAPKLDATTALGRTSFLDNRSGSSGQQRLIGQGESPQSFNGMRVLSHTVEGSPSPLTRPNIRLAQTVPGAPAPSNPTGTRPFTLPDQLPTPRPMQGQLKDLTTLEQIQRFSPFAGPEATVDGQYLLGNDATTYLKDLRVKELYDAEVSYLSRFGEVPQSERLNIFRKARNAASKVTGDPGFLQKYGAAGLGVAGLFAATKPFETPKQKPFKSKFDPIPQSKIDPLRIDISPPPPPEAPIQFSAHGGEMQNFPPRIGAISGPGTGTSDDVPAMLSDGEFVMTAQAVRGAGNGSRRQGVENLYNLMRNFEATV